jgi:phosphoadenosine phosphosulfate reductase
METNIKFMASALEGEPILVMFSGGKDSIVCLDLALKYFPRDRLTFISYYFVPDLSIKERILTWYEDKYKIEIHREPDSKVIAYETGRKSYKQSDQEFAIRKKYNAKYLMQGIRKQDSMGRRGMLAHLDHGIDERNGKLYPIGDWSTRQVFSYIKLRKLALPIEYSMGMPRDFYIPNGRGMQFLKNNFPEDYAKVIEVFPNLEMMSRRVEFYGN